MKSQEEKAIECSSSPPAWPAAGEGIKVGTGQCPPLGLVAALSRVSLVS